MAALQSPISILIRHRHSVRCHMTSLFRFFGTESIYGSETSKPNSRLTFEVAQEVCNMMRTRPRWEQTLVSEFPGFNFSDPSFVQQLLKLQSNLLLSSRFISWCVSHYGCAPDHSSSELLFNALVEAKACNAAKWLIDLTGFEPGPDSFVRYNHCLWEGGSIKDAMEASSKLKELAVCPKLGTWNMAFSRCLKLGRNNLVFRLYREFIESGMVADTETVEYLIQAFCDAGKVVEGYELLRQVIEDGIVPRNISFNKLIRGFLRKGETGRMSQLLHLMIEKNQMPDIYTYQEVINGLCKRKMTTEILMIFNNLKSRGYFPDRVMYTTMIQGLCDGGLIGEARKLWFEMISKGLAPNKYTYSAMIHGYFRTKEIVEATKLFHEKPDKSLRESRVFYNNMVRMLSSKGRIGEAWKIFEELPQKGVYRNAITYSAMIQGLCREGKLVVVTGLLKDSLQKGILPLSIEAYVAIFESLCKVGRIQEAQNLCRDMESRGMASTGWYNHVIVGFCKQGSVTEAMDQLVNMLKRGLEPSFEMLLWLLKFVVKRGRMDDSSIVLNSILLRRHSLPKHTLRSIVLGLCTKGGKCKVNSLVQKLCKEGDEASQARIIEGS